MPWFPSFKKAPRVVHPPTGIEPQPETTIEELEAALKDLEANKDNWVKVSCAERAALLEEVLTRMGPELLPYAKEAVKSRGVYGQGLGEEMGLLGATGVQIASVREAMKENGQPKPVSVKQRPSGQHVVQVYPKGGFSLLFAGWKYDVWVEPGKEPTIGELYREKAAGVEKQGAISLVLGSGNHPVSVMSDIVMKLFAEDEVVIVKMNPVNDFLGPFMEKILATFIRRGWLRVVYGGVAVGKHLVGHPLVKSIHMTGSATSFNYIMWGAPVAPAEGEPILTKPLAGELGNVTPCIIVPAQYTDAEIEYHAISVAAGVLVNGGYNCCSTRVLVMDKSWPQREKFLNAYRRYLNRTPQRALWYPGSAAVYEDFKKKFPNAEELGQAYEGCSPSLLAVGLSPEEADVSREYWAPVVQEVLLPDCEGDVTKFLKKAADFCNNTCWGTLSATVIMHPSVEQAHPKECDELMEELKYGTIVYNAPAHYGYIASAWGAYPGHDIRNIGSGNCRSCHNAGFVDHPQKTVVTVPFKMPAILWDLNATCGEVLNPASLSFAQTHQSMFASLRKFPGLILSQLLY